MRHFLYILEVTIFYIFTLLKNVFGEVHMDNIIYGLNLDVD